MYKFLGTLLLALGATTNAHGADAELFTAADGIKMYREGDDTDKLHYELHVNGMLHGALGTQLYLYTLAHGVDNGRRMFLASCPGSATPFDVTMWIAAKKDLRELPLAVTVPKVVHDTCHKKEKQS